MGQKKRVDLRNALFLQEGFDMLPGAGRAIIDHHNSVIRTKKNAISGTDIQHIHRKTGVRVIDHQDRQKQEQDEVTRTPEFQKGKPSFKIMLIRLPQA